MSKKVLNGLDLGADVYMSGDISPAQITSNQNDYNPTGLSTAAILRLSTGASRNITGLAGGADGREILVLNVGSNDLVLVDNSGSSTSGNRFSLPNGNVTLSGGMSAKFWYDSTSTVWRLIATSKDWGGVPDSSIDIVIAPDMDNAVRWSTATLASGATLAFGTDGLTIITSATSGGNGRASYGTTSGYNFATGNIDFSCIAQIQLEGTNYQTFWGLGRPTTAAAGLTMTDRHIGFEIQRSGGTTTLYATTGDGTTQTKTAITTLSPGSDQLYQFIKDGTTSVKFYLDGVLKATHTTNIPTTLPTALFGVCATNRNTASSTIISVGTLHYRNKLSIGAGAGTSVFSDDVFRVTDNGDTTKKVALEVSGITTGTTRTLTVPNWSGNVIAPSGNGSAGQYLQSAGASQPVWAGVNLVELTSAAPTGTSNTTGLMQGLGLSITTGANTSGIIQVIASGAVTNNTASDGWKYQIRYGTGAAPTNGAALTGTAVGRLTTGTLGTGTNRAIMPFSIIAKISGLAANTTYWVDLSLAAVTGGTATLTDVCINAQEL